MEEKDVEVLITALQDKNWLVRYNAAEVLVNIKDARAVEPLIAALQDESPYVRQKAAEALSRIKSVQVVKPLIAALQDRDSDVRRQATVALEAIIDPQVVDSLTTIVLRDKDWSVRLQAAEALGFIKDARGMEPLIAALQDDNSDVRKQAAIALKAIGGISEQDIVNQVWYLIASQQWDACVKLGVSAVEPLIAVLQDRDSDVRRNAIEALGNIKDARAVEPLITVLRDKDWSMRRQVTEALGIIKDVRAVKPLLSILNSESDWGAREVTSRVLGCFLPDLSTDLRNQVESELRRYQREYREHQVYMHEIYDKENC